MSLYRSRDSIFDKEPLSAEEVVLKIANESSMYVGGQLERLEYEVCELKRIIAIVVKNVDEATKEKIMDDLSYDKVGDDPMEAL